MPTYVYECQKCGHQFEELQGINDPPRRRCPECRGAVKRLLMPGGGLIFKGSGFYITDYKKKEDRARASGANKSKPSSSDSGSSASGAEEA
jgi:putative FmdB family regulatory protein